MTREAGPHKGNPAPAEAATPDSTVRHTADRRPLRTDDQVREIASLYAAGGVTQQQLAVRFGVSQGVIAKVTAGKAWRHVVREPVTVGRGRRLTEMPGRPA